MDAAEAAVGEHGDDIAGQRLGLYGGDDCRVVREVIALPTHRRNVGGKADGIEPVVFRNLVEIGDRGDDGEVRQRQRLGEFLLEHGAPRGV